MTTKRKVMVDISNLLTPSNYQKKYGLSRMTPYNRMESGAVRFVTINGLKFIIDQ
jgi:hypothetical protein